MFFLTPFFLVSLAGGTPDAPTLESPPEGASGVSTCATLGAGVRDPDGDALTVTFYGRKAAADFSIVVLADTQ